jgi:HAD superfamily hydrolase (TIGR01458 family)
MKLDKGTNMSDFDKIRGILFDLDGVLYVGDSIIPGAIETINRLRDNNFTLRFSTNTTTKSQETLFNKIRRLKLPFEKSEIISAPQVAVRYLRNIGNPKCYFCVNDDLINDFSEFAISEENPEYIIIGDINDRWNYKILNRLFRMIINGAELIALHKGRFWHEPDGLYIDIGAFVSALEYSTGKRAKIIGKPSQSFFRLVVDDMNLLPEQAVMIGDDIESDIGGAQAAGLKGILVRTGKYRKRFTDKSKVVPDAIIDSVAGLTELMSPFTE